MGRAAWRRSVRQNLSRIEHVARIAHDCQISNGLLNRHIDLALKSHYQKALAVSKLIDPLEPESECLALAQSIDLFTPHNGPVRWHLQEKRREGSFRYVCTPDIALQARNRIIREVITARMQPGPHIYNWKERGCPRQALAIKHAIENVGSYVVIADVRDCYQNVDIDAVYGLNLIPPEVLRYALDHRHFQFVQTQTRDRTGKLVYTTPIAHGEQTRPAGLLQGLASSDVLWAALINDMPEHLPTDVVSFVYGDNVTIVCPSAKHAEEARAALVRYFSEHRAGGFSLQISIEDSRESFEQTGYFFQQIQGEVFIGLSYNNFEALDRRCDEQIRVLGAKPMQEEVLAASRKLIAPFGALSPEFRRQLILDFIERFVSPEWFFPVICDHKLGRPSGYVISKG